jgi:hypothetical protein
MEAVRVTSADRLNLGPYMNFSGVFLVEVVMPHGSLILVV